MWVEFAVTKARTTPEPVPTSRMRGEEGLVEGWKWVVSQADSVAAERVSRKR